MNTALTVPTLSIFFMGVSILLSIGLPVGLFIAWRKKYNLKAMPVLVGTSAFILFAMILEQLMHMLVLRPDENGNFALLRDNPVLYVIYGIFAAGIFEETARLISYKFVLRKHEGIGTALSYGIGHGGVEAALLAGVTMLSNIAVSIVINSGMETDPTLVSALTDTSSYMFLVGGIERVFAVVIQISLSVIMWYAVTKSGKTWLFPVAILLHAAIDLPAAMYQAGYITSILLIEVIVGVCALAVAAIAVSIHKSFKRDEAGGINF